MDKSHLFSYSMDIYVASNHPPMFFLSSHFKIIHNLIFTYFKIINIYCYDPDPGICNYGINITYN